MPFITVLQNTECIRAEGEFKGYGQVWYENFCCKFSFLPFLGGGGLFLQFPEKIKQNLFIFDTR